MIIKNKELEKMLKEKGRRYTLTMYVNRFFHMWLEKHKRGD